MVFEVGVRVENDILVRARHFKSKKERVSMFRALVHTSFVADNVIRLTAADLDGASGDAYPSDFFVDLIFTDARNQSNVNMTKKGGGVKINVEEEERKLM